MINSWLILPIIIPLLTAVICLFGYSNCTYQRWISFTGSLALFATSIWLITIVWRDGIQVVQIGSWPMPFGITLVADMFSAIMVVLAGLVGMAVQVYSLASIDSQREAFGYYPLYHILLLGVCGAFLTGDLFNLYVWFEVMLMASFVLMALGGERNQMEGAIKYVTINLLSSAIFLAAIGILYGVVGTLNMADLSDKLSRLEQAPGVLNVLAVLFMVAFGIKAAVFPLFFWLPDSYHTPPAAVSAVFAGLLTKVGVYALIRVFTLIFIQDAEFFHQLLLWIAGLTMVTGVLGAVAQNEVRRILSFHIISQIGYMVMGLALFTPLALTAAVFYIAHHVIVKTNLFLIGGLLERMGRTPQLKYLGGVYRARPLLGVLFLIPALSLAGLPPLSGFFAKLGLLQAGLEGNQFVIVAVALFVSLLTLFSMTKIWNEAFWKPAPAVEAHAVNPVENEHIIWPLWLAPIVLLASITLIIGFGAGGTFALALRAGQELMNPAGYILAVFGSSQ
jgi:multicomponent Na+:H+ antiporter subunit D